jgi:hypothetical protein
MRVEAVIAGTVLGAMFACSRPAEEAPHTDAAAPVVSAEVTVREPVDRAKAERIGLFYARMRWARYAPTVATGFNTGHGEYRIVIGFDRRPDAATVFVRSSDGQLLDASIAPGDY